MGRDHRRRPQTKRRFRQIESREEDELETVDDLAHAAQFAIFPASAAGATSLIESADSAKEDGDDNEIEMGDDDDVDNSDSDTSAPDAASNEDGDKHDDDHEDSDDNESDDELAETIQRMEQATAEEESNPIATASNPPKTENEVDGYKVPIQELESQLQIQLTVQGGTRLTDAKNDSMEVSMNEVSLAGKIKNYMILDRTVVVESVASLSSPRGSLGPLDEGSLLVVKKFSDTDDDEDAAKATWIPLGRIFEVFGPVSQPLYTIRLPSPLNEEKKQNSNRLFRNKSKKKGSTQDHEQISAGEVDAEEDKASIGAHQNGTETTTFNTEENTATETAAKIKSFNEGSESATKNEDTSDSPSLPSPSESGEKPMPCQEKAVSKPDTEESIAPQDDEQQDSVIDPWAVDGEYAKFLSQNKDVEVYYIQDEAKLIDTGLVLRTSGKGCDASNIYDEEIFDSSEAYYSDDEKEREAKNKRKGATRKKSELRNSHQHQNNYSRPRNFHQQQFRNNAPAGFSNFSGPVRPPPPPPPRSYGYGQHGGSLPQGFHRMTQPSTLYQYPVQSSFHSVPPPPPPPPLPDQLYQYQNTAPASSSMQPPPPPPRNPNEPPAYQY